ncbi:hypothetical protein N9017_02515 [Akkermansiaceae bacterium]|nr:hypothetical protein [Akkermansiaceae bacterium]MDB4566678.1 hypothetical protein [Akkermansiaceae bacterium]
MAFALSDDADNELVGAKGAVAHEEVTFLKMPEELWCDTGVVLTGVVLTGVVLTGVAGLDGGESSVAEIDQSNEAHFGVSTARFLAVDLWVVLLVFFRVFKGDAGAVNRF